MDFYVLDHNETLLFVRNDASEAIHFEDEYRLTATFPIVDDKPMQRGQLIGFYDIDDALQLFEIRRALPIEPDHVVEIVADHSARAELSDEVIEDVRPTNVQAGAAATSALLGSRWALGTAEASGLASTNYYYISRWESLQKVATTWGITLRFRWVLGSTGISARYVDVLSRQGAARGKRFELDKDIESIKVTYDDTGVYTRLYGRGKGEEVGTTDAGDPTYGRRLTFSDVVWSTGAGKPVNKPAGQEWVEDAAATAVYGRAGRPRIGVVIFDDITDPAELLQATWDRLQAVKAPLITIDATVQDMEAIWGHQHEAVRLGDDVAVIVQPAGLELYASITKLARNLLCGEQTNIIIGNYRLDATDMQAAQEKALAQMAEAARIGSEVATANPSLLNRALDTMITSIMSSGTKRYTDPIDGGEIYESDDGTTAMKQTGRGWMIAQSKIGGVWQWTVAATGAGIVANAITTGVLQAALVKILGTDKFYWDASNLYIIDPANNNKQIRIGQYDGTHYGIAFTANGGATWTLALGHAGINGTDIDLSSNSAITIKADKTYVDGIPVGGKNLIKNSGLFKDNSYWGASWDAFSTIATPPTAGNGNDNGNPVQIINFITGTSAAGGWIILFNSSFRSYRFRVGQKYTISGRLYSQRAYSSTLQICDANATNSVGASITLALVPGYQDFSYTFTATAVGNMPDLRFHCEISNTQFAIQYVKLEEGSHATGWTPAPEETDGRITSTEASIEVQAGQIALKASQSSVDALGQTVEDQGTSITANASAITLKADKTYVDNGLSGKAGTAEVTADAIKLKVGQIGASNLVRNGSFKLGSNGWTINGGALETAGRLDTSAYASAGALGQTKYCMQQISLGNVTGKIILSCYTKSTSIVAGPTNFMASLYAEVIDGADTIHYVASINVLGTTDWTRRSIVVDPSTFVNKSVKTIRVYGYTRDFTGKIWFDDFMISEGETLSAWSPNPSELKSSSVEIDDDSVTIDTKNFALTLRDESNNAALQIDATTKGFKTAGTYAGSPMEMNLSQSGLASKVAAKQASMFGPGGLYLYNWQNDGLGSLFQLSQSRNMPSGEFTVEMMLRAAATKFAGYVYDSGAYAAVLEAYNKQAVPAGYEVINFFENIHMHGYTLSGVGGIYAPNAFAHNPVEYASSLDANTVIHPFSLCNVNIPTGWGYAFIIQLIYAGVGTGNNRAQIATSYNTGAALANRHYYNGAWTAWAIN